MLFKVYRKLNHRSYIQNALIKAWKFRAVEECHFLYHKEPSEFQVMLPHASCGTLKANTVTIAEVLMDVTLKSTSLGYMNDAAEIYADGHTK